jgi:hypothetical protein
MNKKVKTSLLIAGIGAFALSTAVTIGAKAESDILRARVDDRCNEIRSVQTYIEAKKDYEQMILNAYQAGALTQSEYDKKLDYAVSNDFIRDNSDKILSEQESQSLHADIDAGNRAVQTGICGVASTLISGVGITMISALATQTSQNNRDESLLAKRTYGSCGSKGRDDDEIYEEEHYYGA